MSTQSIVQALNNMTKLHRSMLALAKNKTDIIKKGDISSLQVLLKDENKHIQVIKKLESNLINETQAFFQNKGFVQEQPSLSKVLELATDVEREVLEQEKVELEHAIEELRAQNQLNQELLEQSLQFVNISLDLLQPDIDSFNYEATDNTRSERQPNHSLFDSKA